FSRVATWSLLVWVALRCLEAVLCRVSVQEPPAVRSKLPILGQALKLFTQGVSYYENLRKQTNLPILTTFLGTQKVYVVNSPELINQINRQGKKIDATLPFLSVVCGKFFGMHGEDLNGLMRNATAKNSLRHDLRAMEHAALEAGTESMAEIHGNISRELADILNDTASRGPEKVNLLDWLQRTFTLATGRGVFGHGNPVDRSEDLVSCLWTMESGLKKLTMLPYQSFTAREAVMARERLVQAFIDDKDPKGPVGLGRGSIVLSQKFSNLTQRHNTSVEFKARYTLGFFTGFLINSVPAVFWIVSLLAANKGLADRIRSEVQQVVTTIGSEEITVEAASLRSQCQVLVSTCREVLRCISSSIGTFLVNDDIHLDDGLVLKKGAIIQIAATAIHSNTAIWGTSANELDPERFLRQEKVHPAANRVFGGGGSMCPGRHLALDELLTFTAMFVHTFEVDLLPNASRIPEQERNAMLSVKKPSSDLLVRVSRRAAANCRRWKF
ncbi:uncharacterized protein GLRG_11805, partial [Colletotrichum graminicola M1.001]